MAKYTMYSSEYSGATDFYEELGVDHSATPQEIKKAYRKRAMELHPDNGMHPDKEKPGYAPPDEMMLKGKKLQFQNLNYAFLILSDPKQKHNYDLGGNLVLKREVEERRNEVYRRQGEEQGETRQQQEQAREQQKRDAEEAQRQREERENGKKDQEQEGQAGNKEENEANAGSQQQSNGQEGQQADQNREDAWWDKLRDRAEGKFRERFDGWRRRKEGQQQEEEQQEGQDEARREQAARAEQNGEASSPQQEGQTPQQEEETPPPANMKEGVKINRDKENETRKHSKERMADAIKEHRKRQKEEREGANRSREGARAGSPEGNTPSGGENGR